MARLCCREENIVITCEDKAFVFRLGSSEYTSLQLPQQKHLDCKTKSQEDDEKPDKEDPREKDIISCVALSSCGKWLVLCSANKNLCIYETTSWTLISERSIPRGASNVVFSPQNKFIVVVDKSGDAFSFSVENLQEEGKLLLGHLSMLLDVVISPDEKYIITCDRDEKIRVSNFPNAYNIVSYCLGHLEFVSSLSLVPHDSSILLSGSGDGTVRLWNYTAGTLIKSYDCSADALHQFCFSENLNSEKDVKLAVSKICCSKLHNSSSVVCVLLHHGFGCLLYYLSEIFVLKLLQVLRFNNEPLDVSFSKSSSLWLYTRDKDDTLVSFDFNKNTDLYSKTNCSESLCVISEVQNMSNDFLGRLEKTYNVTQLFKRKFDNIKGYLERKKARLDESSGKLNV